MMTPEENADTTPDMTARRDFDVQRLIWTPPADGGDNEESWWLEQIAYTHSQGCGAAATARCALLPRELDHLTERREGDKHFERKYEHWRAVVEAEELELIIEQATDDSGLLLPYELRRLRICGAPSEWDAGLRWLLRHVQPHVLAHLLMWVTWEVRILRGRRQGHPHWRPHETPHDPPPAFAASAFTPRDYAR